MKYGAALFVLCTVYYFGELFYHYAYHPIAPFLLAAPSFALIFIYMTVIREKPLTPVNCQLKEVQ